MNNHHRILFIITIILLTIPSPALSKSAKPQVIQTGPRQFIQTIALTNNASATATVVADWSEEARIAGILSSVLSDLSRIDITANGAEGELSKINNLQKGQKIALSSEFFDFISKSCSLAGQTNGWFDIVKSPSGGWFSAKNFHRIALDQTDKSLMFKTNDMRLDISNIWPAYLVDTAIARLTAEGITNAKVEVANVNRNVGQDIYTPWKVAIELPNPNLQNAYRSYFYSFSNRAAVSLIPDRLTTEIIDPRNNQPVSNSYKNITVFGKDSMTASAFAVALYVLGKKQKDALEFVEGHPEIKGIFVDGDGRLSTSKDLVITQTNYSQEEAPSIVDRGPNDIRQKQREEEKE